MATLIRRGLVQEGFAADLAGTGEDALRMAASHDYDAIVLDVMLPGFNGFETCRRLRSGGVWAPVLMLTARDSVEDRVAGLDTGADDYLVKPFAFAELLARLRALVRRGDLERPSVLSVGDLTARSRESGGRAGRRGDRALREGVRASGDVYAATRAMSYRASTSSSTPGISPTRTGRTSSTSSSDISGERSTSRSAGGRSKP